MSLAKSTRLGHYEVLELIGKGGMGEVYRGFDTQLKREVALKVLPERFSRDAERLARFRREATVLASLNHPNIAAIHRLEQSGDTHALVIVRQSAGDGPGPRRLGPCDHESHHRSPPRPHFSAE